MRKVETMTFEYKNCWECSNVLGYGLRKEEPGSGKCGKTKKKISDIWGEIPEWCPLPDKEK